MGSQNFRELKGIERLRFAIDLRTSDYRRFPKMKVVAWNAFQLDNRRFVKRGPYVRVTEAKTMEFIANNTTIPIPKLLDTFTYNGDTHIITTYVNASVLEDVWESLSGEEQASCMQQLGEYIRQLRELPCPEPGKVQAVDGRGCWDNRLHWPGEYGPFARHSDFSKALNHDHVRQNPELYPEAAELFAKAGGKDRRTVFSHGDLGPQNILWKDGKIVAILDWEMSGWFPDYWEYTRTYFGCRLESWWEAFQNVTETYPDELAVAKMMASHFVRVRV